MLAAALPARVTKTVAQVHFVTLVSAFPLKKSRRSVCSALIVPPASPAWMRSVLPGFELRSVLPGATTRPCHLTHVTD
jgi:hypothetical protein